MPSHFMAKKAFIPFLIIIISQFSHECRISKRFPIGNTAESWIVPSKYLHIAQGQWMNVPMQYSLPIKIDLNSSGSPPTPQMHLLALAPLFTLALIGLSFSANAELLEENNNFAETTAIGEGDERQVLFLAFLADEWITLSTFLAHSDWPQSAQCGMPWSD